MDNGWWSWEWKSVVPRVGIWTALPCCLMIIFSLVIDGTSQILYKWVYVYNLEETPQLLKSVLGPRSCREFCVLSCDNLWYGRLPPLGYEWFFNVPSLSPILSSVNHGVTRLGEGRKFWCVVAPSRSQSGLLIFLPLPSSFPFLPPTLRLLSSPWE